MIEWIPTVISTSISAVMRLFGRGGKPVQAIVKPR